MFNGDLQKGEYNQIVSIGAGTRLVGQQVVMHKDYIMQYKTLVDLRLRKRTGANSKSIRNRPIPKSSITWFYNRGIIRQGQMLKDYL